MRNQSGLNRDEFLALAKLVMGLGFYWAWASCVFFGIIAFPFYENSRMASELVHIVALAACSCITLLLGLIGRSGCLLWVSSLVPSSILAATGSAMIALAPFVGDFAVIPAAIVAGVGEGLLLFRLCMTLKPSAGSKIVLAVFSLALVVGGLLYIGTFFIGGVAAAVLTVFMPVVAACVTGATGETRVTCRDAPVVFRYGEHRAASMGRLRGFPWKVTVGFSVFGIAFGVMRWAAPEAVSSFSDFFLLHEGVRLLTGLTVAVIALVSKNRYWKTCLLGIIFFVGAFLTCYSELIGATGLVLNAFATAGYTCFELLMWVVIYEIASETGFGMLAPYCLGRGMMQVGTFLGAAAPMLLDTGNLAVPVFQSTIVAMLVMMLGVFSERDMSEMWGAPKKSIEQAPGGDALLERKLADCFSLSPRECDVALMLSKGRSEPFIAEALTLSRSTVHSHIARIYIKMGVHSRQEFLSKAESIIWNQ